jgi:N-acetylmuramoyl-L-alanine amidase
MLNQLFAVFLSITGSIHQIPEAKQFHCLAETIYHEARGEPMDGQQTVGSVVLKRAGTEGFPDTICKVVYQPKQFSWVGRVKAPKRDSEDYIKSEVVAVTLIAKQTLGLMPAPNQAYNNATFFSREPIKLKYTKLKYLGMIGNHRFYEMKPQRG